MRHRRERTENMYIVKKLRSGIPLVGITIQPIQITNTIANMGP